MPLSQLFFHMLPLKALTKLKVTDRYRSDLNISMNQYHLFICDIHQPCGWVRNNVESVWALQLIVRNKSFIEIN